MDCLKHSLASLQGRIPSHGCYVQTSDFSSVQFTSWYVNFRCAWCLKFPPEGRYDIDDSCYSVSVPETILRNNGKGHTKQPRRPPAIYGRFLTGPARLRLESFAEIDVET